ncbi:MAG: hypothetical protein JSS49_25905 [Planctomycetes bacterium]|nr:hypothetical protein [Planctomycetota bacterium]
MSFDPQDMPVFDAIVYWMVVVGVLSIIVMVVSLLSLLVSHRGAGLRIFAEEILRSLTDLFSLSIRRIWALSKLTFIEAYRRKALAVFVVFALLFMFAGWFMGGDTRDMTTDQVKVYVSFVLRTIAWLTLPLIVVLSSFGIPEEIRVRSLHTVVTKPARRLEIVLGRVFGFSMIGTLVLLVMSGVGYIWIVRQVPASARDMLVCRVPVYGKLQFLDRAGNPADKGVNVGDLWEFRSYIEGATKARAIWVFPGIGERTLDSDGNLHLENQFLAFRSYKGNMKQSLLYDYQFRNPDTGATYTTEARPINENRGVTDVISRKLVSRTDGKTYDLIKDFVARDGTLRIEVSCIDREQYLGMARPDLFIRKPDVSFAVGFFKAAAGIEIMMILVVLLAVTGSTFLKGPIATVLTSVLMILGGEKAHAFMDQLMIGRSDKGGFQGGGFFESIYRIITHMNPTTELPDNMGFTIMTGVDGLLTGFLWLCKQVIPRLQYFNMSEYVSNGFDVPFGSTLLPCLLILVGYFLPCVMLGYFALRIRELESK